MPYSQIVSRFILTRSREVKYLGVAVKWGSWLADSRVYIQLAHEFKNLRLPKYLLTVCIVIKNKQTTLHLLASIQAVPLWEHNPHPTSLSTRKLHTSLKLPQVLPSAALLLHLAHTNVLSVVLLWSMWLFTISLQESELLKAENLVLPAVYPGLPHSTFHRASVWSIFVLEIVVGVALRFLVFNIYLSQQICIEIYIINFNSII